MSHPDRTRFAAQDTLARLHPDTAALAAAVDDTRAHGRVVGLTDDETAEVVGAWVEHHHARTDPVSWPAVRRALTARAMGDRWRP